LELFNLTIYASDVQFNGISPFMNDADYKGYGVYLFFATMMILSIPYVFFLLPETKGIPLEDVNSLFRKGLRPWRAHAVVLAEIREARQDIGERGTVEDVKRAASHDEASHV
jgi:Sugar (and other) transporter